jgi:hypothetical protein
MYIEKIQEKLKELKNKKDIIVLGIESSCDETSIAIVKNGRTVLSNIVSSQIEIHTRFGGVVPEVASRNHIEAIDNVLNESLKQANLTLSFEGKTETYKIDLQQYDLQVGLYDTASTTQIIETPDIEFIKYFTVKFYNNDEYLTFISEIEELDEREINQEAITVYVVDSNEKLFDVAKNLLVKPEDLLIQNNITEEDVKEGVRLVVYSTIDTKFNN